MNCPVCGRPVAAITRSPIWVDAPYAPDVPDLAPALTGPVCAAKHKNAPDCEITESQWGALFAGLDHG